MPSGLEVETREVARGAAILELSGEIDMTTESLLAGRFRELADRGLTDVIIDARNVSFMDSTGINAFMGGKKTIHEKGSRIFLVASPIVLRVLDLVFQGPVFAERFDTIDEALAALDSSE